jgi:predicted dithiol-disulfide oxidoreductase (DUF899 family)
MPSHQIGTREQWLAARGELLAKEKELTRRSDQLAAERRNLPWVPIEKQYRFDTEAGPKTLAELFAGCPVCSSIADGFNGNMSHLNARDTTFTCISRAPIDKLQAYKKRMGWDFPWASSDGGDYAFDLEVAHPTEVARSWLAGGVPPVAALMADACGTEPAVYVSESPILNTYTLEDGTVYLTYSTTARGLEFMMVYYGLLDRTPLGRNEVDDEALWLRRHDEYPGH